MIDLRIEEELRCRIFSSLCESMDAQFKCLLFHTDVRWLSKGKVWIMLVIPPEVTEMLKKASIRTIKRYLCSNGLCRIMTSRKPFLTTTHVRKRKKWCAAYLNMDTEKWKDFIFSDECQLQTYENVTRIVRRPKNCKHGINYVVQTKKNGWLHIMVWGAIKTDGSRILVRYPRRPN